MIIIFIGPPFSGKGTQADLLSKDLGIPVFSMGEILRNAKKEGNPKAIEGYEKFAMKGLNLPIDLKFDLLRERMDNAFNGFILDNFPATGEDLEALLKYIKENNLTIDKVFYFKISEEEMKKRIKQRGREDDVYEIILARRVNQDKDRIPVINYLREKGLLEELNGEDTIENIHNKIKNCLKND